MASRSDEVILERDFLLLPKRKGRYRVTLSYGGIYFSLISNNSAHYEESLLKISDIVGCHSLCKRDRSTPNPLSRPNDKDNIESGYVEPQNFLRHIRNALTRFSCGFVIFAYPFVKKKLSSKQVRQRQVFAFEIPSSTNSEEEFEKNTSDADKWCNVINCLSRDIPLNLQDLSSNIPPQRKRWLFLINPFSGPGKAHTIFKQDIIPVLFEASIPYKAIVTTHAGHASELVKTIDLSEWYGVVIVSGDGLIFETINGIMQRDDWASSLKTPIGCLPGGSGNALCCSINYAAGEPVDSSMVLHSTFVLVKHRVVPMDLVAVHLPDQTLFSFLSITWGIMADIDYESEKYRNLGETRFTVGAVNRILGLRTYKGRVSFLPIAEYVPMADNDTKVLSKIRRLSLRSRSSSKATLNSLEDDRNGNAAKLIGHKSFSMDENGFRDCQLYTETGEAASLTETSSPLIEEEIKTNKNLEENMKNFEMEKSFPASEGGDAANFIHSDLQLPIQSVSGLPNSIGAGDNKLYKNDPNQLHIDQKVVENGHNYISRAASDLNSSHEDFHPEQVTPTPNSHNHTGKGYTPTSQCTADWVPQCVEKKSDHMTVLKTGGSSGEGRDAAGNDEEVGVEEETYLGRKADYSPVPMPLLAPLDQPVPESWFSVEGDFVLVLGVYQTHLGSDMLAAPDARLQDGLINLMMVRKGVSKAAMFRLFLSFSQGNHVTSPHVEIIKVLAFRLEPFSSNGNIMVDGERFDPAPIQAQVLPGLARVMAIK
ncbi:sphingosine kinase [Plakobranchus ocellatus]|uniref:Sphingosine kinase n=1 Tax=Plakobranchus ocellatus TaxID=259542 RepID=A0AAV4CLU7_9GAST|nr:sphingosine kinase [Plakobranchus ocellatus]